MTPLQVQIIVKLFPAQGFQLAPVPLFVGLKVPVLQFGLETPFTEIGGQTGQPMAT